MENKHRDRIAQLRALMAENGWDAVIITGTDPHCSEYPAQRWKCVRWLTGFTGEAADAVITMDHAGLWTDSRYFIQAAEQLEGSGVVLHKTRVQDEIRIPEWLCLHFERESICIAIDGLCQNTQAVLDLENRLSETFSQENVKICDVPDILSVLWKDRPDIPDTPVTIPDEWTLGETRSQKIRWIRQWMKDKGCEFMLLSSLDEIAWLLNIRGSDIEYNPYTISYLLISGKELKWFVHKKRDIPQVEGIRIMEYGQIEEYLKCLTRVGKIYLDPETLNYSVFKAVRWSFVGHNIISGPSPVILRKAVKNNVETGGFRDIFIKDGLVMVKFLHWLETEVSSGETVTEWDASMHLTALRKEIEGYRGDSFENISAYGANAALPHYSTPKEGSSRIEGKGLYLVDSGGQYLSGTTDITRTVPVGPCTHLEKEDYTIVLKGMIDLSMAVFPKGTAGCQIDAIAREPIWKMRRNFGHGTGHGIGFYLGVHEGPQSIRQNFNRQMLLPGMVTSNEPGLYREGMHGIRHENVLLCVEDDTNEFGQWLKFETLTCCHIDTTPVIREMLTEEERLWLNSYNRSVYVRLEPLLETDIRKWLRRKTVSI